MTNTFRWMGGIISITAMLLFTSPAHAIILGNPAPNFKAGDIGVGVALDDIRETLFLDIGISEPGTLQVLVGNFEVNQVEGSEFGVGYRHDTGASFNLFEQDFKMGGLASFRRGTIEIEGTSEEFAFSQLYIGFGAAITPVDNLNVYAAGIYERLSGEATNPVTGKKIDTTESGIGLLLGAEYWLGENIVGGLEMHPGLEDDEIAIFGQYKF